MKTKKLILKVTLLFFAGLIMSCTNGTIHNPDKVELTSDNYMDIAVIEKNYYLAEIDRVEKELDSLKKIIDDPSHVNENAQKAYDKGLQERESIQKTMAGIVEIEDLPMPRVPPTPDPCGPGTTCFAVFSELEHFITPLDGRIVAISIYTEKGESFTSNDGKLIPMPGYESKLNYTSVDFGNYKGKAFVKMTTKDGEALELSGVIY